MPLSDSHLEKICTTLAHELENSGLYFDTNSTLENLRILQGQFETVDLLKKKFNDEFCDFLNEVLSWSYGFGINQNKSRGVITFPKNKPDKNRFAQKVNLFNLIGYLVEEYPHKYNQYKFQRQTTLEETDITLTAGFFENFWDNIYNDYDTYRGDDGKEICLFNKGRHSIGSYLHCAHQNIHYLHITAPDHPNPICTAILMECSGGTRDSAKEPYLVVEGVLGNFKSLEEYKPKIYSFLWHSIKQFAFKRGKHVFLNGSHSVNQQEPEEFIKQVSLEEKIAMPWHVLKEINGKKEKISFTHKFSLADDMALVQRISHKTKSDSLYKGEQYADAFYLINRGELPRKEHFNSFFELGGYAQGFEVRCPKSRRSLLVKVGTGLASLVLAGSILYPRANSPSYQGINPSVPGIFSVVATVNGKAKEFHLEKAEKIEILEKKGFSVEEMNPLESDLVFSAHPRASIRITESGVKYEITEEDPEDLAYLMHGLNLLRKSPKWVKATLTPYFYQARLKEVSMKDGIRYADYRDRGISRVQIEMLAQCDNNSLLRVADLFTRLQRRKLPQFNNLLDVLDKLSCFEVSDFINHVSRDDFLNLLEKMKEDIFRVSLEPIVGGNAWLYKTHAIPEPLWQETLAMLHRMIDIYKKSSEYQGTKEKLRMYQQRSSSRSAFPRSLSTVCFDDWQVGGEAEKILGEVTIYHCVGPDWFADILNSLPAVYEGLAWYHARILTTAVLNITSGEVAAHAFKTFSNIAVLPKSALQYEKKAMMELLLNNFLEYTKTHQPANIDAYLEALDLLSMESENYQFIHDVQNFSLLLRDHACLTDLLAPVLEYRKHLTRAESGALLIRDGKLYDRSRGLAKARIKEIASLMRDSFSCKNINEK